MDRHFPVYTKKHTDHSETEYSRLKILNAFAVDLIPIDDEVELAWYVAREVVAKLGFDDCVVYFFDVKRNLLRQTATIGPKNPHNHEIINRLEIPLGQGVTGQVAQTRKAVIIDDLRNTENYIPDLEKALSEICVPLESSGQLLGVVDCEGKKLSSFGQEHLQMLSSVAALMSAKLEYIHKCKALNESERRNQLIFDSSLDGIISIDSHGTIVECNKAVISMFGFDRDQIQGKLLGETLIPPELRERHFAGFHQFIQTGERSVTEQRMETTGLRSNGERFPLELTVTSYFSEGQQFLTGFMRDITERIKAKAAEKEGRDIERKFSAVIEHLPSAFLIKDLDGNYLHANTQWHEWFNPEGLDLTDKTAFDFFSAEYARKADIQDKLAIKFKKSFEKEIPSPIVDGTMVTFLTQKFPILDENGDVVAVGGLNTDINSRIKMEEELRQALLKAEEASHSKSVFLATMSHELRTPLNAIIGFSDMLRGQYFGELGSEKYLEYAQNIHSSGKHLSALIGEVLDISSIELGVQDLEFKKISLEEILEDCINAVTLNAQKRELKITEVIGDNLPFILADEKALKQIFLNLMTNAVKFCDPGDYIQITALPADQVVEISVSDTGRGIESEYLSTLTDPFVRGHDNSHTTHEGVGLGLSIVKLLVDAHNGSLKIESKVGEGTSVIVTLPLPQNDLETQ